MATFQKVKRKTGYAYVAIISKKNTKPFSKTFARKTDAKAWAARIEQDQEYLAARGIGSQSDITLKDLLIKFEAQYRKKDTAIICRLRYWGERLGHYKLYDIDKALIRNELTIISNTPTQYGNSKIKGHKRSNGTINSFKAALSSLLNFAVDIERVLESNPVRGIKNLPLDNKRTRYLKPKELSSLLNACKSSEWDKLYLLVLMAITTGARQGELLGLSWKDINLKKSFAYLADTKNGSPRYLSLTDNVKAELCKFQGIGNALVFASELKPDRAFEFRKHWDRAVINSKIEIGEGKDKFVFHSLRHTAASYLVMANKGLAEVASIMGHKSHTTTLRYAHLSEDHKQATIDEVMGDIG